MFNTQKFWYITKIIFEKHRRIKTNILEYLLMVKMVKMNCAKLLITISVLFLGMNDAFGETVMKYILGISPGIMHVTMNYSPIQKDSTSFSYGNSFCGGMTDLIKSLINLKSSAKFRIDTIASKIIFYYSDNHTVDISYDIIDTHTPEQKVVGEMFRPIITNNYFFSLTQTIFLNPDIDEKYADSLTMSVTLKENPAFPMFFSFAPEMKPEETVCLSISEGLNGLITGATDLYIEKRESVGIQNYIVLRINESNKYNLTRFMEYFDKFLPAMTDFWGNLNGKYYTLVASPFLNIKKHNISGTAFNSGFHVKFSGDTILANEEVIVVISHEIMHRYIGTGSISIDNDNQWFNEGFTDYSTWYLLARCGIVSNKRFKEIIHESYNSLSNNPYKNATNEEIKKHFWDNHYYEKLPYNRGALFAAFIDRRINQISNGKISYRDFMLSLKEYAGNKGQSLSIEDFLSVASKFIPKDEIEISLKEYIMQGKMLPYNVLFSE